jgi:hypothetical protein
MQEGGFCYCYAAYVCTLLQISLESPIITLLSHKERHNSNRSGFLSHLGNAYTNILQETTPNGKKYDFGIYGGSKSVG